MDLWQHQTAASWQGDTSCAGGMLYGQDRELGMPQDRHTTTYDHGLRGVLAQRRSLDDLDSVTMLGGLCKRQSCRPCRKLAGSASVHTLPKQV